MYSHTGAINNTEFESWRQLYRYSLIHKLNPINRQVVFDPGSQVVPKTPQFVMELPARDIRHLTSTNTNPNSFRDRESNSSSSFSLTTIGSSMLESENYGSSISSSLSSHSEHLVDTSINELRGLILGMQHKTESELEEVRQTLYTELMSVYTITNRLRQLISQNGEIILTRIYASNLQSVDFRLLASVPISGPRINEFLPFTLSFIYTGPSKLVIKVSGHSAELPEPEDTADSSVESLFSSEEVLNYEFPTPSNDSGPAMHIMQGRMVHLFTGIEVSFDFSKDLVPKRIPLQEVSLLELYTIAAADHTITLTEVCTYPITQLAWKQDNS
jgi:hypothetical protein